MAEFVYEMSLIIKATIMHDGRPVDLFTDIDFMQYPVEPYDAVKEL